MLRYEMLWLLSHHDMDVEGTPLEMSLNPLPNNGIEIVFNGWVLKLLRPRNGEVPPPGRSIRKRQFFCQMPLFLLDDQSASQVRLNAVILLDFAQEYQQVSLALAVPYEVVGDYEQVRCYYIVEIPHPAPQVSDTLTDGGCDTTTELDVRLKEPHPEVDNEKETERGNDLQREDKAGPGA